MAHENNSSPSQNETLEGTTLAVYAYVAKSSWPVGTRDVVRNLGLSSSSVAFRHLQKLEALGLVSKTVSGEYVGRAKAKVRGYIWVGHYLVSRTLVYSFFFVVALAFEVAVLLWHFEVENYEFKVFFSLLALITLSALMLFLLEGVRTIVRSRRKLLSAST
jgi:hypothetical protein